MSLLYGAHEDTPRVEGTIAVFGDYMVMVSCEILVVMSKDGRLNSLPRDDRIALYVKSSFSRVIQGVKEWETQGQ